MKQKLFLSSMLIMSVAPAMAETFPSNGLMQENTTYTNAATETNMAGVYEGSVNATAEYTDILYNIVAGNYLPGGSEDINGTQCTPGNFCTGLTNATYSESDQGLTSCSTLGDGSYTLSPAGATNGNMCYKTCSASCTNPTSPAHSTNVSYGNETSNGTWNYGSTCNAVAPTCSINFDCVNGYHKRPDLTVAQGVALMKQMAQAQGQDITNVPDSYFEEQIEQAFANWETLWSSLSAAEQGMVTQAIDSVQGHTSQTTIQDVPVYQIFNNTFSKYGINMGNINETFFTFVFYNKNINGDEYCKTNDGEISCDILSNQYSELEQFRQNAQNGDWFSFIPTENISMSGVSRCVNEESSPCEVSYSKINGGVVNTSYIKGGGDLFDGWNFKHNSETGDGKTCEEVCTQEASEDAFVYVIMYALGKNNLGTSGNISVSEQHIQRFDSLFEGKTVPSFITSAYIDYMCDANTININWLGADDEDITANNAGTAKYDGDIRTPVKAQTIKGKTFRGWRFSNPQTTNLPE